MLDALSWFFVNLWSGITGIFIALGNLAAWTNWEEDKQSLMRFIYYGASVELFFAVTVIMLILLVIGLFFRPFLWGVVRTIEFGQNWIGRIFAYAGLLMVLQQVMIVFLQRIFREAAITVGIPDTPFQFTRDISWWSEELKLYNAMIVALCVGYTFVQGGHVRVDLFYAGIKFRTKKIVDMIGSLFFLMPLTVIVWLFAWFFMWRNLVTPPVAPTDTLDRLMTKARALRWNVETIGFSPNGFDQYWMFKVLILSFAGLMFLMAWSFFYRSLLEYIEGPASADKYLDKDRIGDEIAETAAEIH
ncbi:C4-dicarboxylate ABC transporter permease [Roseobacter sp. HKCCA0434]|uniref:TRAP transporter small permease subunit n=1 Tax=Roseobacter sp. HKCCA0434 TaxID=3079297 RepID=UPI002905BDAD|nr:C4-dicarboxylate ABC transporter permease [Roseobacter sp. HKCCA0434]